MMTAGAFPVAISITSTMGQVGTALAPLVTGIVLDSYGWSTVFAGLSVASLIGFVVQATVAETICAPGRDGAKQAFAIGERATLRLEIETNAPISQSDRTKRSRPTRPRSGDEWAS